MKNIPIKRTLALIAASVFLSFCGPTKKVYFISPADGASVKSPVKIIMGVEGMTVAEAGQVVEGVGHHHLIIRGGPVGAGEIVPKDDTHIHFGKGQKDAEIKLEPGNYTLTLQFADGAHKSYGPEMSSTIHITVTE